MDRFLPSNNRSVFDLPNAIGSSANTSTRSDLSTATLSIVATTRIYYEFTTFFANLLWIHCLYCEFSKNSRGYSLILYEFSWCFANIIQIHYPFCELTINPLSRINYFITIFIADSPKNPLMFRELTINSLFFREFIIYSLSLSQIHQEITWCFANELWIHCLFREFFMNPLSISRLN